MLELNVPTAPEEESGLLSWAQRLVAVLNSPREEEIQEYQHLSILSGTFIDNVTGFGGVYYFLDNFSNVHITGFVNTSDAVAVTLGATIGMLPVGYRPKRNLNLNGGIQGTWEYARVGVDTSGNLRYFGPNIALNVNSLAFSGIFKAS